jgi:hypothetical protein
MYTEGFPKLLDLILKFTSDSGATVLYFDQKLLTFSLTKQSKLKCRKVLFLSTILLWFFGIRTVQAELSHSDQFPFPICTILHY